MATGRGALEPDDSDLDLARPRAVPLTKEYGFPPTEGGLAVMHWRGARRTAQHRLDVRIRVALRVLERRLLGHNLGKVRLDVAGDGGVGALVDGHARGGMRNEDLADAVGDAGSLDGRAHLVGDVDQLRAPPAVDLERNPAPLAPLTCLQYRAGARMPSRIGSPPPPPPPGA